MKQLLSLIFLLMIVPRLHGQTADQYLEQGVKKGKSGNQTGAIEDFKKAMSLHPQLAIQIIERGLTMSDNRSKEAKIIAPNLVFQGNQYQAEIFLAAIASSSSLSVVMDLNDPTSSRATPSIYEDNGVMRYSQQTTNEGLQHYSGNIIERLPSGVEKRYPFHGEYMVMRSAVVVSPTKMNVLYRGVKNPVSVSVPGVAPELVYPSITGGTISPDSRSGKGNYIVKTTGGSTVVLQISAQIEGKTRPMGEFSFRVKDPPSPIATIAGVEEGLVSANRLKAAPTVIPKMKNFDFELFFQVTKFDIVYQIGTDLITKQIVGNSIPADDLDQIGRLRLGSRVYIESIKAIMLDENNRPASGAMPMSLSPVSLKIQ